MSSRRVRKTSFPTVSAKLKACWVALILAEEGYCSDRGKFGTFIEMLVFLLCMDSQLQFCKKNRRLFGVDRNKSPR